MARRREDRYPDAVVLAADIERYLADEPVSAYPEPWHAHFRRWARRHRAVVLAAGIPLFLLVVGAVAGGLLWRDQEQRRQQQDAAHLEGMQRSAEESERFALLRTRRGHYSSAETLLNQALVGIENEPRLQELASRLRARRDCTRGLVAYYQHADEAEKLSFLEYDPDSLLACEAAIDSLGILRDPNWMHHLPMEELTDPDRASNQDGQLVQVREDVYRSFMLLAALRARGFLTKTAGDPGAEAAYRSALEAAQQAHRYRPSFSGRLLEVYCRFQLNELGQLGPAQVKEPNSAADYYFCGMAHFWLGAAEGDPLVQILRFPLLRPLLGLDFVHPKATAERQLRTAAELAPQHYWTRLFLGWTLGESGNRPLGAEALGSCVALRPDYGMAYALRGHMLIFQIQPADPPERRQDLVRRGLQDLDRAIALDPAEPFVYVMKSAALTRLGRPAQALESITRALELERPLDFWEGQLNAAEKRDEFNFARALAEGQTQTDADPTEAWSVVAFAQLGLGNLAEAETAAGHALEKHPDHSRALVVRGSLSLKKHDAEAALRDFTAAQAGTPRSYHAAQGRARALEDLARPAQALDAFDHVLAECAATNWQKAQAHLGRARVLVQLGRADEARQALDAAQPLRTWSSTTSRFSVSP
jgi:tetratricopeptide (TPR) repeat protein